MRLLLTKPVAAALAVSILVLFCGCASLVKPDTVPVSRLNHNAESVDTADAKAAAAKCMTYADNTLLLSSPYLRLLKGTALGTTVGAATGGVSGSIFGEEGESVASGAAVGAIVGLIQSFVEIKTRPAFYERFVERCLDDKGFEVIGWR